MNQLNQEFLYCIEHNQMESIDLCNFPLKWAFIPPPVFADVEREPYQEELEEAEQGAQEFLLTLEEA